MWSYPTIVIAVLGYCFLLYWWLLSLLTMFPVAYPDFGPDIQGLLMIGLILGTILSEVFVSGRLSDWIVIKLARRNNNIRTPEMRLWLWYPAIIFVMIGLIVWGRSIDAGWHWITGQIAWFLCTFPWFVVADEQLLAGFRWAIRLSQAMLSTISRHMQWKLLHFIRSY